MTIAQLQLFSDLSKTCCHYPFIIGILEMKTATLFQSTVIVEKRVVLSKQSLEVNTKLVCHYLFVLR
jgi:hypothetical protein